MNEINQRISREQLLGYPDGTWILTDRGTTTILDSAHMDSPKPQSDLGWWWRRKQLMDQLGING